MGTITEQKDRALMRNVLLFCANIDNYYSESAHMLPQLFLEIRIYNYIMCGREAAKHCDVDLPQNNMWVVRQGQRQHAAWTWGGGGKLLDWILIIHSNCTVY